MLVWGKDVSVGDVTKLEKGEEVSKILEKKGIKVTKRGKKNKHAKEEERQERERILGPAPIENA